MSLQTSDIERSERFYEIVLQTVGLEKTGGMAWQDFRLAEASGDEVTRGLHIGFVAPSRAHVDEFWRAGTAAGYQDDGAPGPRPEYGDDYYGGFLLDPDGNSAEAVHHDSLREGGAVDHLWIRVGDVQRSKRFYEEIGPRAGFRLDHDAPERAQFVGESGSFSVVSGRASEHVRMAFPAYVEGTEQTLVDPDGNTVEIVAQAAF